MHSLIHELLDKGAAVTDGAWGTQLQQRGLASGEFPDLWNLTNADKVFEVALAYVNAGSHVILTNTFGANRLRLQEQDLAGKVREINTQGVILSKKATAGKAKVFASIGPTGKMLLSGETSEEELLDVFLEQSRAIAAGGADGIVIETMADLTEATIAVQAAKSTGLPVVACMVYDSGKEKDRTLMGVTPEKAAKGLQEAGADVIGANCGQGIAGFINICRRLKASTNCPVWIKANAGLPEIVEGKSVYRTSPEEFSSFAKPLVEAGASFLGGCCGTSPEFIKALKIAL